jgi:phospholipid/cholesterol/gamma-HCH transport system substrate-binding protein
MSAVVGGARPIPGAGGRRTPRIRRPRRTVRRTRTIGVVVLAIFGAGIVLAYMRPSLFSSQRTVQIMFSTATGLGVVGRDVTVAGTPVGQITGVQRVGDHALLTLSLDSPVVVHADATAELRPHLPFEGTAYIDLQPGSPSAPRLGDRVLSMSHTSVYVPVQQALSVLTPPTRAATRADTAGLSSVLSGAGISGLQRTFGGAPALTATLAPAAAAALGSEGTELAGSVAGLARTVSAFDLHQSQLEPLLAQAADTTGALAVQSGAPLSATLAQLPETLSSLQSGSDALQGILDRLDPLAGELAPGLRALPVTLRATEPLLVQAAPVLRGALPLLVHLRRALDAGAASRPAADTLLRSLAPSLALLSRSLLPALLAPTAKLHVPAYLSFINLFEGGGGASQPFQNAAQAAMPGQTGIGHFMRFGARFFTGAGYPLPPCTLLTKVSPTLAKLFAQDGICSS